MTPDERERMILDSQGLVWKVVLRVAAPDRREEALSFGQEGLIFAVDRFDPSRGNKFSTYAYKCIWGYVLRGLYLRPAHWRPTVPVDFGGEFEEAGSAPEPVDHRTESVWAPVVREDVWERIRKVLEPRRFEMIYEHFVGGKTLAEIGTKFSLTKERIRTLIDSGIQTILNRVPDLVDLLPVSVNEPFCFNVTPKSALE